MTSIARVPSVPSVAITPFRATAMVCVVASDHGPSASRGVAVGWFGPGRPVAGSKAKRTGWERPRSEIVARSVASSSQNGPWRPLTIQPLRSVSTQLPTGRSRFGASATGGREPSAGPTMTPGTEVVERLGLEQPDRRDPAPVRGPRGVVRPAAPGPGSRAARPRGRCGESEPASTAQIVVRGCRSGSGPRSAVNAIVRPSGCHAMSSTP